MQLLGFDILFEPIIIIIIQVIILVFVVHKKNILITS